MLLRADSSWEGNGASIVYNPPIVRIASANAAPPHVLRILAAQNSRAWPCTKKQSFIVCGEKSTSTPIHWVFPALEYG